MLLEAIVRRFPIAKALSEATTSARLTGHLSVAVAQTEAEFAEMTRSGRRFIGTCGALSTNIAPVTTVPTTTTQWSVYNADPVRSYVIDCVNFMQSASTTPATGGCILGIVSPITTTIPTTNSTGVILNASSGGATSKAILSSAYAIPTLIAANQGAAWFVMPGQQGQCAVGTAATALGANFNADVRGRVIVPPGKILGLALLAGTGTASYFVASVTWHEVELDLE